MKFTVNEIKKTLQGTNSGVDEAKNQINNLEHKEEKKSFNQNSERKKESKKNKDRLMSFRTTSNIPTFESQGCQMEKRKKSKKFKTI